LADVDGDGRLDLLTGSDSCCAREPGFYWFQRGADGVYTARPKVRMKAGAEEPFMPQFRATLADWDGDGSQEVVAALTLIKPGLYRSKGAWSPSAEVAAPRPVQGSPDMLSHQPCIADWDNDGRLDLLVVSPGSGVIVWQRNIARWCEPILAGPRPLLTLPAGESAFGLSTGDWDHDGWTDPVIGYVRIEREREGAYKYASSGVRVCLRRGRVALDR
jgi:hypothetical protein